MERSKNRAKSALKRNQRLQSGYFHVWFRGNCKFTVFHEKKDFIEFLSRCNRFATHYNSSITAFVLMDNHVHLQVRTENLTQFISALLISFTQWSNRKKDLSGSLFESPFSSSKIYNLESLEHNFLYILTNPVRAGICKTINDYPWSSYHTYLPDNLNPLRSYIVVDNTVMSKLFSSVSELKKKADDFIWKSNQQSESNSGLIISSDPINNLNSNQNSKKSSANWRRVPDNEIAQYLNLLLEGRKLSELSRDESIRIAKILRYKGCASIRQIASLTNESYVEIRKIL